MPKRVLLVRVKTKRSKYLIRGIKEYQFVYGNNGTSAGSGDGSENEDRIGEDKAGKNGKGEGHTVIRKAKTFMRQKSLLKS